MGRGNVDGTGVGRRMGMGGVEPPTNHPPVVPSVTIPSFLEYLPIFGSCFDFFISAKLAPQVVEYNSLVFSFVFVIQSLSLVKTRHLFKHDPILK